jgi:hypothetical protein
LYEKETVIKFIQKKIKKHSNFEDILDDIPPKNFTTGIGENTVDKSLKGFYYERLWDLCIKFGVTDLTLPSTILGSKSYLQTSHIINTNTNVASVNFEENCWSGDKLNASRTGYLHQKVRSGNSGGYSDITFINKPYGGETEEVFFISVKYFEHERDISQYDIGKLCTLIREHEKQNRTVKIYIFVNNKKNAIEKFKKQNVSSNILIKYINPNGEYEHVYDSADLHNAYYKLRRLLEQYNYFENANNIEDFQQIYLAQLKTPFVPRFHQRLFIRKIRDLVKSKNKNILVGAIPRSGKSYIMAGTIIDCIEQQKDKSKKLTFLMMTPAPNETFPEYESMFKQYSDFARLGVKPIYMNTTDLESVVDAEKHCVIVISKQKLGWSSSKLEKLANNEIVTDAEKEDDDAPLNKDEDELAKIRKRVSELFGGRVNIDYMFLDEAHFGMSTQKAQDIVSVLDDEAKNTTKIYVTATYNKPLETYGIDAKCKLTWDINDIEIMKNISQSNILSNDIATRFGKDVYEDTLEFFGDKSGKLLVPRLQKEYSIYPKPYLITSLWDKDFLKFEKALIGETDFGWDMGKLFATDGTNFKNKEQIIEIMRYYFGQPNKGENYNVQAFYRSRGILPRIQKICTNKCRTLQTLHKTTQLWFLPLKGSVGDTIDKRVIALINLFKHTNEFKHVLRSYHFYVAVDVKKKENHANFTYMKDPHNIKNEIESLEDQIKRGEFKEGDNKPDNLIILAGQRLQLGISLRNVDIVTLWNSTMSDDALFQMLFRSMTEVNVPPCVENEYCNEKKFGFMVDMNPQRAIMNVSMFNTNMAKQTDPKTGKMQEYKQICDLINIDEDVFQDKYDGDEKQKEEFVRELFKKLYSAWDSSSDGVRKTVSKFSFDQGVLESIKDKIREIQIQSDKKNAKEIQKPGEDERMSPGRKQEGTKAEKKGNKQTKPPVEINLQQIAVEIISELVTLLNIFTLYLDDGSKCILTGSTEPDQVRIIGEIGKLKQTVFGDTKRKDIFLKILNGRLNGNPDVQYPDEIIDKVLESISNTTNVMLLDKMVIDQKTHYYTINDLDKLLIYIDSQLKPKEKEKKENGEVFTPLQLVNEMLDKLDESYIKQNGRSIFTEKDFKWFDPAVGIGNFPIIVYQRLMIGLASQITEEEARRKHILENMLYMSEITPKNVFICKKIFCGDAYDLNIYEGDTLKMDINEVFKRKLPAKFEGFEVILGNPPFQKKVGPTKTESLWDKFIVKSLSVLKSYGYLVFVHPSGWRNIDGHFKNIQKEILSRNLQYLEMHGEKDGLKMFTCSTRYDWYVLQNNNRVESTTTIVRFQDETVKTINVNGLEFIPNGEYDKIMSIIAKNGEERTNVIHDYSLYETRKKWMSKTKTEEYKYPCVYTVNSKSEPTFFYSSMQHGHFGVPKLIWSNGGNPGSYVDINGNYGLTQFSYAIIDNPEHLQKIKTAFDSNEFRNLMELSTFGQGHINYKVISLLKKDFWKLFLDNTVYEGQLNETSKSPEKQHSPDRIPSPLSSKSDSTKSRESKKRSSKISIPSAASKSKRKTKKTSPKPQSPPVDSKIQPGKIFNPITKRLIKDTKANRKKIGFPGGSIANKTRKTLKHKNT